ncbi:MAG: SNF2-related protein, partial [Thermoanaerobaculia bacterium]
MSTQATHPIHRRWLAEQFVRLRRADERRRYAASQRRGRIDPNPHQVDAVIFALGRVREGGCILADEVGLGKTIEAGLIIVQLMAEGAQRVLIVVPKPLQGQWQQELYTLFGVEVSDGSLADETALDGGGVFLVGREWAGGERGSERLLAAEPFDLCVIDEAHEIFAGIYKRYDRHGVYQPGSPHAQMAGRVKELVAGTPVLLLTATPIQNSLVELWGLVQYVEPTGTLLGDVSTFRQVFCDGDDGKLVAGQDEELRQRLATVCKRTLRRQAQEFLERPFVNRQARLFEYSMTDEEKALYEDLTRFLLEPSLAAFRGNQRRLLIISFHRQMASSVRALTASLDKVAERLRRMLGGISLEALDAEGLSLADDLEEEVEETEVDEGAPPAPDRVRAELERVESFIARAEALPRDSKADTLINAVKLVLSRAERGEGSGKMVIFTESLSTQKYIRDLLLIAGLAKDDVTLFRGQNEGPRVAAALERWKREVGDAIPAYNRPSCAVAVRMALVHEFRTRSRVFVSTEAGAKGLNLQFCDTLVNYDLPWNPQRIEQRIGRCHRYGQEHDVTVINFLTPDNQAQKLTFEILSQKLDLFGKVLDASDHVLHEPRTKTPETIASALAIDIETRLGRIYDRARTPEQIVDELRELRENIGSRRD